MIGPLGKKVVPPAPPPGPEWVDHPTNKRIEVHTVTGSLRTKSYAPPQRSPVVKLSPMSLWPWLPDGSIDPRSQLFGGQP